MSRKRNNILRKRIAGASLSSVVSISLVLLLVEISAILAFNAKTVENYFKENIHITAFLKKGTSASNAEKVRKDLQKEPFVKSTRYVSVEEGTKELVDMLGEDFADVFVTSPVPSSIEVTVYSRYFQTDSLDMVLNRIVEYPYIESAVTQAAIVASLGEVTTQAGLVLGIVVLLLTFISIVLISNTVRLNIYASRFSIHTMQLVGAGNFFIARPFLRRSMLMGALSALIACAIIAGGLVYIRKFFPQVFELLDVRAFVVVGAALFVLGVLVCLLCAASVMRKLVKLDKDELYG